jgi:hypothetical protein
VRAWLAGSAIDVITTHRTDPASARHILEFGVQIEHSRTDGSWGRGFYSGTRMGPEYGDTSVRVAVRILYPFRVADHIAGQEEVDRLLAQEGSDDVRATLLRAGYDGVVVEWAPGDLWVVAYSNEQVRVVWSP